jgi:hypothetical protein
MLPWLQVLAFAPLAAAARVRRVEHRTVARLKDAGANVAERGILLQRGGLVNEFVFRRLLRAEALQPAGNDRYYLNSAAYERFRVVRRRRALFVFTIVLIIVAALYFRGDLAS